MCGIIGVWQKNKQQASLQLLVQMRDIMYNRGPDDAGIWIDGPVGFGHRRLSIIDLSSLGHQPMIDEETGSVITYNGEVYNYKEIKKKLEEYGLNFRSQSDTEVILKSYRKWGASCVKRFIGMFSFAIWDNILKGIFIARDRMGIKPLYYYNTDKIFMFASRLNALMQHPMCPSDIDSEALGLYLDIGFVPAPWCMLKGIKKLKPGHTLWIDKNGLSEDGYWTLDDINIDYSLLKADETELVNRLDSLLRDSVRLRLISDVPVGAFLSGGIDSSVVVALMSQFLNKPVKTFTIGFKEKQYNESIYAQKIAEHLGTNHTTEVMQSKDLMSLLDDNTLYYDEPLADCSTLPTMMVSRIAKKHVTVCLSGDGGDELFAGYPYYLILFYLRYFYHTPYSFRFLLGRAITMLNNHIAAVIGKCFFEDNLIDCFAFLRSIIKDYERSSFFLSNALNIKELFSERSFRFPRLDEISNLCRLDAAYYLTDDILQKVDIASMSVSLEARVPLLDHRVVEFAQSLPLKFKLRHGNSKWILKKVLSKYVPLKLFERPKRGFLVPLDKWFRNELKGMIQDELSPLRIKQFGFFNPSGIKKIIDLHMSGRRNTQPLLWALLVLFRWKKSFLKMQ